LKLGAVYREADNRCLVPRVWKAASAIERMRGLLGRPPLLADEGLLIDACNMVHTVGMRYALDLVFLNATGHVQKLVHNVKPLRCAGALAAKSTLELPAGSLTLLNLRMGEQLIWRTVAI
jgi:uncharacterized membrane protein (UPF0127 family)